MQSIFSTQVEVIFNFAYFPKVRSPDILLEIGPITFGKFQKDSAKIY